MSSRTLLRIQLPPEGTLVRDLVVNALLYIADRGGWLDVELELEPQQRVAVLAPSQSNVEEIFRNLYNFGAEQLDEKRNYMRRIGILRNDQTILNKLTRTNVKGMDYAEVISTFLKGAQPSFDDLSRSLPNLQFSANSLKLGEGEYAMLNPLIPERYETGTEFWRINISRKLEVRADRTWYGLILSGFATALSGYVSDEILLTLVHEPLVWLRTRELISAFNKAFGGRANYYGRISNVIARERLHVEPMQEFLIFLASRLSEGISEAALMEIPSTVVNFCRLRRTETVFTMLSKQSSDMSSLLRFALRLRSKSEYASNRLGELAQRTISIYHGARLREGEHLEPYHRFFTLLFQAIHGAYQPFEAIYFGARSGVLSRVVRGELEVDRRLVESLISVFAGGRL